MCEMMIDDDDDRQIKILIDKQIVDHKQINKQKYRQMDKQIVDDR